MYDLVNSGVEQHSSAVIGALMKLCMTSLIAGSNSASTIIQQLQGAVYDLVNSGVEQQDIIHSELLVSCV